jgi:hypothetical protein
VTRSRMYASYFAAQIEKDNKKQINSGAPR